MFITVTFLTLLIRIPIGTSFLGSCVPNSHFIVKGKICVCNNAGQWTEDNCKLIARRQLCQAGEVIWQGCNQCVCQKNGQLICTDTNCDDGTYSIISALSIQGINVLGTWCAPFRSYYVNCQICVCPASGRTSNVRCATDSTCDLESPTPLTQSNFLAYVNKNTCLPKVMYLFPCLHCLCADEGYFTLDKCVEMCQRPEPKPVIRRCIPRTFYKYNCNVCLCPDSRVPDHRLCTRNQCDDKSKTLRSKAKTCAPHQFTKKKCRYCRCNSRGHINFNHCLDLECITGVSNVYSNDRTRCKPNDIVPVCMECFCLKNGTTNPTYCSKSCDDTSKFYVLNKVILDSFKYSQLIDRGAFQNMPRNNECIPNSVYKERGRFCLCSENGNINYRLCSNILETDPLIDTKRTQLVTTDSMTTPPVQLDIDFDAFCEPSTFVEFDCNTCFCSKKGKIDPLWCTYDDCSTKKRVQESHKTIPVNHSQDGRCIPGSISKKGCNYCICPESGLYKERACTLNTCLEPEPITSISTSFSCEPLAYFEVDCNVCYCPIDGLKNVAKCTKNVCNKKSLRTESCAPHQLFSEDCNVCVCPSNGEKKDKVCTNHTCSHNFVKWDKILTLTNNLQSKHSVQVNVKALDQCFPGEEFSDGCQVCLCPDMGLKSYATCSSGVCPYMLADNNDFSNQSLSAIDGRRGCPVGVVPDQKPEREACTAGSMYIIRCRQCICPYKGNINEFCRPLPDNVYCEQAYPNYNYLPSGRRGGEDSAVYNCGHPGKLMDECFICECRENKTVALNECFQSDAENCKDLKPRFLEIN